MFGLAVVNFLGSIAHEALPTIFVLYAMYRYGWNERMVGLAIATVGVCSALVGAGMVQPLVARFGDRRVMLGGMWFNVAGFFIYGLASTGLLFWSGIPVGGLGGLANPPMQSLMTRRVKETEQGQLQGALSSIRGIAFMIGPIIFTTTFASFIGPNRDRHLPGAPYILAAAIVMLSIAIAARATARSAEEKSSRRRSLKRPSSSINLPLMALEGRPGESASELIHARIAGVHAAVDDHRGTGNPFGVVAGEEQRHRSRCPRACRRAESAASAPCLRRALPRRRASRDTISGVTMPPGHMQLTRIRSWPRSIAADSRDADDCGFRRAVCA